MSSKDSLMMAFLFSYVCGVVLIRTQMELELVFLFDFVTIL